MPPIPLKLICLAALALIMQPASGSSLTSARSKDLPNFYKMTDQLYRGGQPNEAGLRELKQMGITTVIDLRDDDARALKESAAVQAVGMRFINVPLDNWDRPKVEEINAIIKLIDTEGNQPVFIHCRRGSDRTGTVIAVYRITHDGWTGKQAIDEAKTFGIGWWQYGMHDFINDYYRDQKDAIHN